jgi:hypothetical protein
MLYRRLMGYTALYFQHAVQFWFDKGWLAPQRGQRIVEFGAQEFFADAADTRREVGAFLGRHGASAETISSVLGAELPQVDAIYEAVGIDYLSIDVDEAHGSTFFDLNTFEAPAAWRNAFDFVNNEGTLEHLAKPLNGFHVAHDIAKVGGIVRHNFPLIGWSQHGFANLTTKFYAHLVGDNAYEVLKVHATVTESTPFDDPLFTTCSALTGDPENPIRMIPPPAVTNIWGELVYRKIHDRPFVMPVDHVEGPNAVAVRERLAANYHRLGRIAKP